MARARRRTGSQVDLFDIAAPGYRGMDPGMVIADEAPPGNQTSTRSRVRDTGRILVAVARDATQDPNWSEVTAGME
jgi:hypothetical protein